MWRTATEAGNGPRQHQLRAINSQPVPSAQRWTEEQQAEVYKYQLIMFAEIPQLRGITPWVLFDFRSTTRNIPKLQDGYNRKDLFSEFGGRSRRSSFCKRHTLTLPSANRNEMTRS